MSDFRQFVPEHIRKLAEGNQSRPLKQSGSLVKPIALNLNENPFGPSPLALKAIEAALSDIHRYPEIQACDLHKEIADFHGVEVKQVLVTAGATELLCMIARVLLAPGLATRDNGYDLDAIAHAIDANTRIVFIANPNNPTGTLVSAEEVSGFIEKIPDHVLVILDEAYGDFAEYFAEKRGITYSRSLDYVRQDRNVILLKTFSKTHGLAGLRIGYGVGPARLISLFAPLRTIFSVSSVAQAAAVAALRDQEHVRRAGENNAVQAEVLSEGIERLRVHVPPTWANFLYCELGQNAAGFAERLQAAGIIVQPLEQWGAPTAIRVSIGKPEENRRFLNALHDLRSGARTTY